MGKKRGKLNMGWKKKPSNGMDDIGVRRLMDRIAAAYKLGYHETFQELKQEIESHGVEVTIKENGALSFTTPWGSEDQPNLLNTMLLDVLKRAKENDHPSEDTSSESDT